MSNTTKEEKTTILEELKAQAAAIADKIKEATDAHLKTLHEKLQAAHEQVQSITAEIRSHTGEAAAEAPKRRGRKPGSKNAAPKPAKGGKKFKSKRGEVGEKITAFITSKGKSGAHVKEIATATGYKVNNITAFFYAKGNKAKFKNLGKATFALKK